jgi:hypothetical protein
VPGFLPAARCQDLADFGDAEGFRERIKQMKDGVKIEQAG